MFPKNFIESIAIILFAYAGSFFLSVLSLLFDPTIVMQLIILAACVLFVIGTWFINKKRKTPFSLDFGTNGLKLLPLLLFIIFLYQLGVSFPMSNFYNSLFKPETSESDIPMIFSLGAIILAPIAEEIMFRNIILKGMQNTYKPQKAIILSSILFAVIHIKPLFVINAFFLGLLFAWVFFKTSNLTITVVMHSFANFISLFPDYIKSRSLENKLLNVFEMDNEHQIHFAVLAFITLCISLLYLNKKFNTKNKLLSSD